MSTSLVTAQTPDYHTIVVNYREIQLVQEEGVNSLLTTYPALQSNPEISDIIGDNSTLFWEAIGAYDVDFSSNSSMRTIVLVQINSTGFFQTHVGLNEQQDAILSISLINPLYSTNFTNVVSSATDFFVDDGHYWGLCEEIIVVPGSLEGRSEDIIWRVKFYLVAEQERWTLLLDTSGLILNSQAITVPCQSCDNSLPIILGASGVAVVTIIIIVYLVQRRDQ
jgi:hypothetical protein